MKQTNAPIVVAAGALTVFAAVSGKIAEHVRTSQRNVLIVIVCGYIVLFIMLMANVRKGRHRF